MYGYLPELPSHALLQKAKGRLGVSQKKTGIIDQKILSCSRAVKEKMAGWIPLEYSSHDEYSEVSKEIWGLDPENGILNVWEGKMGRTVMPYSQVMEFERERLKPFRRALSKEDQQAFDRLFDRAKMHTSAGVYMARS